jgi:hypothetical protein
MFRADCARTLSVTIQREQRRRFLAHPLIGWIVMKARMPVLLDVRRPQPLCDTEFRQESSESVELLDLNL